MSIMTTHMSRTGDRTLVRKISLFIHRQSVHVGPEGNPTGSARNVDVADNSGFPDPFLCLDTCGSQLFRHKSRSSNRIEADLRMHVDISLQIDDTVNHLVCQLLNVNFTNRCHGASLGVLFLDSGLTLCLVEAAHVAVSACMG
jgi:hypothetical protein